MAHGMSACIDDDGVRRQQFLDVCQQEEALLATRNKTGRRRAHQNGCALDLCYERGDVGLASGVLGPGKRRARRLDLQAPNFNSRNN
jgi:hypothetical protein